MRSAGLREADMRHGHISMTAPLPNPKSPISRPTPTPDGTNATPLTARHRPHSTQSVQKRPGGVSTYAASPPGPHTPPGPFARLHCAPPATNVLGAGPAPACVANIVMGFGTGFGSTQTGFGFGPGGIGQQGGFGGLSTPAFGGGGATATGGGMFGGLGVSTGMGSASGLFSANPSSSVFGQQSGPSTAFGSQSVTPAFGSSMPGTGAFGQTTFSSQPTSTGGSAFPLPQRPKGTGRTPFVPKVFVEPDGTGKKPNMCTWHHVSFGDAYKGVPQELLRYEDYQQGNTGGGGLTQGQGAQSTFSPGGLSSQPSLFGGQAGLAVSTAPQSSAGFGLFGGASTSSGVSSGGGLFGGGTGSVSSQPGSSWSFGVSTQPSTSASLFSGFGPKQPAQPSQSLTSGVSSGSSLFGNSSTFSTSGPLFGGTSSSVISTAAPSIFGASSGHSSTLSFGVWNTTTGTGSSLSGFPGFSKMATSVGNPAPVNTGFNFSATSTPQGSQPSLFATAPAQNQPPFSLGASSQALSTPSSLFQPTLGQAGAGSSWMIGSGSGTGCTSSSSQAGTGLFGGAGQTAAQSQRQSIFPQGPTGVPTSPHQMPYGQNPLPQLPDPVGWTGSRMTSNPAGSQVIIVNAAPKQRYPARQLPLSIPPASSRRSLRRSSRSHSRLLSDSDSLFSDQLWRGTASPPRGMDEPLFKREDVKENLGSWDIKACLERTGSSPALLMPGGKGAGGEEANDGSAKETSEEPLRLKNTAISDGESNLSKEDISRLLPAVPQPEYYTRPDLRGLSNMLHADRHALKQVHGLTVGRTGYGELKFLEPVNVEGLNVCDVVSITRGMVSLYEKSPKRDVPVPGQGLNQPAEVKLLDIFKTDKRGEVLDDQASKMAFKNSLKKYCKRVDATFVSYDMEDGTWIFRVNNLV
ncbi:unnamed protein product [Ostreobium quekettii]|uniref:Peptidase S59 domain-containing protein n=1 Tax=Ostreobium quekettii TaxID=121088 RepID=A0A8S1IYX8_9CHLO|nr:unnamed protein product [Ostreobium quekettii]